MHTIPRAYLNRHIDLEKEVFTIIHVSTDKAT